MIDKKQMVTATIKGELYELLGRIPHLETQEVLLLLKHTKTEKICICSSKDLDQGGVTPVQSDTAQQNKEYQHYKGGTYTLLLEAQSSETREDVIVYKSHETGCTWVRPKTMFFEDVTWPDGSAAPRFKKIE